jgi:hypothetical protein
MSRLSDLISKLGINTTPAQEDHPPALSSASHAARSAALKDREREIEEHHSVILGDLRRQQSEANVDRDRAIQEARAIAETQTAKVDAEIAQQICSRFYPLVAEFIHARDSKGKASSPRETAARLASTWRELDARAKDEVGGELDIRHIGLALLACLDADSVERAASCEQYWRDDAVLATLGRASNVMLAAAPVPVVEEALRRADVILAERIQAPHVRGSEICQKRIAAHRGSACDVRRRLALIAIDEERQEERRKALASLRDVVDEPAPKKKRRDLDESDDVLLNPDASVPDVFLSGPG